MNHWDLVIVGGTPGGIMTAIAAARSGKNSLLLERTAHIGGLPANGLGATDIGTRGATGGLFQEFVDRVREYYVSTYGEESQQVADCSGGCHFEPSVSEKVLLQMLAEHEEKITVRKMRQFDSMPENVVVEDGQLREISVLNRESGAAERYRGRIFIDATYEGDLGAAAGVPWRTRREDQSEHNEPMAGRIYKSWGSRPDELGEGSTGEGDDTIQAYNYRLCLTREPSLRVPIERPRAYNRQEYASLVDDVVNHRLAGKLTKEVEMDGIGMLVNIVRLPNGKTDSNNQHLAFISTDLPEENYPWPTAAWSWRDTFAERLRDYILGLLWFAQNDPELPEEFRLKCSEWGLANDEYEDNGNFPRQVYVREGRRMEGEYFFTAHDALPVEPGGRPPVHDTSITASHYALDSHAHHKREDYRVHLDGFFSHPTAPYTVPYGVMVPKKITNLLTPVPVSGTHVGFSTLRMEPCWMGIGHAAGIAAALAINADCAVSAVPVAELQKKLLEQKAVLIYFRDAAPSHPAYAALQKLALRGLIPGWEARLDEQPVENEMRELMDRAGVMLDQEVVAGLKTRGEFIQTIAASARL